MTCKAGCALPGAVFFLGGGRAELEHGGGDAVGAHRCWGSGAGSQLCLWD